MTIEHIAKVAHEINRAYCIAIGDDSQLSWDDAPKWQKDSSINGVEFRIAYPDLCPEDMHNNWWRQKIDEGWVFGPVKDADKKEHPCMVPYSRLNVQQRVKDHLFSQVVDSLK